MDKLRVVLLAGGRGERMKPLTEYRPKPLVPFGGCCHLIDFSLENARSSGASEILLLSQHLEEMLLAYLIRTWLRPDFGVHFGPYQHATTENLDRVLRTVQRPQEKGTADALIKNAPHIFGASYTDVLILHADHVYRFDYRPMLALHRDSGAALTIGYQQIEREYVRLFGQVEVDKDGNLLSFIEKPAEPTCDTVFTAVCLFRADVLQAYLSELERTAWQHDISRDVIPAMLAGGERIKCFRFDDYWEDIGTVDRYRRAHLQLLHATPSLALTQMPMTLHPEFSRRYVSHQKRIRSSIVSEDISPFAQIESSVIYPKARIEPGAIVKNSVLLPGAYVRSGATVQDRVVLEDEVVSALESRHTLLETST